MDLDRETIGLLIVCTILGVWMLWKKHTSPEEKKRREEEVRRHLDEKERRGRCARPPGD